MARLSDEIIQFLHSQGCVIVSTIDSSGSPHNACKGVVEIKRDGEVYLLDLYRGQTYANLKNNPKISITAIDEHRFIGYCLKGRASLIAKERLPAQIIKAWEDKLTSRITRRVLKNIREEKGHPRHPEILLPKPEYLIRMQVERIIDLTPHHLREREK